ncbi:hypothetical protein AK812_SmicGene14157 [Symbiodinium microadriaticum]|uniref:Uncharacterized protein n=1 Tax=Symbiodinium microadriaticum TaxID=2951 RepID=A0A1Q9E663_SYMMI|nr:hypothetical protein AK812_SmicGene14157 [Symbiodinium microadriaticum]CAE7708191.1 unnamed protein product [Symbiodinium microadriaticum]
MDLCWMCAGIDSESCSICGGAGTQGPGLPGPESPRERLQSAQEVVPTEEAAMRSKVKKYTTRSSRQEEEQQAVEQERLLREKQEEERRARERQMPQTMAAPRTPEPARGPRAAPYSAEASRHARAFSHFVEKTAPQASPEADNIINLVPLKPKAKPKSNPTADKLDAQMAALEQLMAAEQTVFAPPPAGYDRMPFAAEHLEATRKSGVDAVKPSEGFVSRTNQPPRQKKLIPQNEMPRQMPSAPFASPTSGPAVLSPSVASLHQHLQQHSQAQASSQLKGFSKEASESSTSRRTADEDAAELPSFADLGRTDERAETKFVDPLSDLLRKVSVVEPERLRPKESSAIAPVSLHFSSRPAKWRQEKQAYTRL